MFENVYSSISPSHQELSSSAETSNAAIKLFEDKGFKVRVIMRRGDPWVVAKDVAACIEHSDTSAMCKLCREKDVLMINGKEYSDDLSEYSESRGNPNIRVISESGLYRILAKCNLPKCEPFENWVFEEVLPSIRKTGKYEVNRAPIPSYMLESEEERAIAWAEEHRQARLALEAKDREIQSLEVERDEAVRTKAMIGSRREAVAMATASAKARECKKLAAENEELTAENEGLKDAIGRGTNWRTVSMMTSEWIRDFGHAPSYHKLKKFSLDLERDEMPVKDVEEKVILKNGSEKVNVVNRYHRKAWELYREYEETMRAVAV